MSGTVADPPKPQPTDRLSQRRQWSVLVGGPLLLIAVSFAVAGPQLGQSHERRRPSAVLPPLPTTGELPQRCQVVADHLKERLPATWAIQIQPPFVLAGEQSAASLTELYSGTVWPTVRALSIGYFDTPIEEPISLVIAKDEASFLASTTALGLGARAEYAGLYDRRCRTIVVNAATGGGTLAHELTHALAHTDFPAMPEWLDEGLASLHEECEFSEDGLRLRGLPNWRNGVLSEAFDRQQFPTLAEFVTQSFASGHRAPLDYAIARNLCLFLQERNLLTEFYRKARFHQQRDPTAGWSLVAILGHAELSSVDREFAQWLRQGKLDVADTTEPDSTSVSDVPSTVDGSLAVADEAERPPEQ
jgi:hypothetical protein